LTDLPLNPVPRTAGGWFRRLTPIALFVLVLFGAWRSGLLDYLSMDALRLHRQQLADYTLAHPVLSLLGYVAVYIVLVVFSIPGALIMTLTGGMLFGAWLGGAAAVTSATTGAVIIFLVGRSAFGDLLRSRTGGMVGRLMDGFERNAASYLLTLRLVPGVPFFAVNLAAGLVRMRLSTYVLVTAIGVAPGSLIYASVGSGLATVFERGEEPDLGVILEPNVMGPLLGLAALSMLPVAYRVWRARRAPTPKRLR